MKKTFYFNTGVRPWNRSKLFGEQIWKDGTIQIPFTCENVPNGAKFLFACNIHDCWELRLKSIIVRRILDYGHNGLLSKFAYFSVPRPHREMLQDFRHMWT